MSGHVAEILQAFDPELPLPKAKTLPAEWYFDREIASLERTSVFRHTWQAVGPLDFVRNPGTFLTADVASEPVLVTRDEQGILRSFANVCRHRAARVMNEAHGCANKLRCRYHGWTYDLAGRLRGTPEFDGVENFPKQGNGLPQFSVATWGPIVFVHQSANPPALESCLAPMPEMAAARGIEKMKFAARREYELNCNWKVFVDNYLDGGYHVNTVHPGLAGVLDYSQYRTEVFAETSVQLSPMRAPDPEKENTSAGNVRTGDMAHYWWIYPNLMVNIYDGVMDTNLVLPVTPDRCRVIFDFYFADADDPSRKQFIDESIEVSHQIQLEDVGICEEVQQGLHSHTYDTGRFSVRREAGGYHFHQLLARKLCSFHRACAGNG